MIFLWTASPLPGSKIIRWGLREPSSHFATCFFEQHGEAAVVLESTYSTGARPVWLGDFRKNKSIVHALQAPVSADEELRLFWSLAARLRGLSYDKRGLAYWALAGIGHRFFNRPLPQHNPWGRSQELLCIETLEQIPEYLEEIEAELPADLGMVSPEQAYIILRDCPHLHEVSL